jgi:hypothetical protein
MPRAGPENDARGTEMPHGKAKMTPGGLKCREQDRKMTPGGLKCREQDWKMTPGELKCRTARPK